MLGRFVFRVAVVLIVGLGACGQLYAKLEYSAESTPDGVRYVVVTGDFATDDNITDFLSVILRHEPGAVVFNSPGGNVGKAMEIGRVIRAFELITIQFRQAECSSACALAFLGGVIRYADPGSIGVHRSSFEDGAELDPDLAVSSVQALTAEIISYMKEMGADPALLELSLRYDASDIRYLSMSEMLQYKVVTTSSLDESPGTSTPEPKAAPPVGSAPASPRYAPSTLTVPTARSGRVRHPAGKVPLKASPDGKSPTLANLNNGIPVRILSNHDRWYRVNAGSVSGYLHHTWVFVDQYATGAFSHRYVQVKSFDNLRDAQAFATASSIPLAAFLATNGWFAVTLADTFELATAKALMASLKANGAIPEDSFVTYGNTYATQICCR